MVSEGRFIILTVAYERRAGRTPPLEFVAPELRDAGLCLIENNQHGWNPFTRWAGLVDEPTFARFADAWHLLDPDGEPASGNPDGKPAMHTHTLDGMNWETRGGSPIVFATVQVWVLENRHGADGRAVVRCRSRTRLERAAR